MATTVKQSKRKAVTNGRRHPLHVYVLAADRKAIESAARLQRRSVSSYIESIVVPQAQRDLGAR